MSTQMSEEDWEHTLMVNLVFEQNADSPGKTALAQALPETCGKTVAGIGLDTAEADTGSTDPVDLVQCDLGLGPVRSPFFRHTCTIQAGCIARPALRQE
jgi:hypothetical protein